MVMEQNQGRLNPPHGLVPVSARRLDEVGAVLATARDRAACARPMSASISPSMSPISRAMASASSMPPPVVTIVLPARQERQPRARW